MASAPPPAPIAQIHPNSSGSDLSVPQNANSLPSSKLPKGRHLIGDHPFYDIDNSFPERPQLEAKLVTPYMPGPGVVLGRRVAINNTYMCYWLKSAGIRVLNIDTALRSLLKGQAQRVTDMAFFAKDIHLLASASVDGRVYVWKITEGRDEKNKPQITGRIVSAIHVTGEGENAHPRVCWHCHKQEVLVVGIGRHILKIDTTIVRKGVKFSADEPLKCSTDKLINGIQLVGSHDGEVTDLSMCQGMTTRLVSASVDGTTKIWDDRNSLLIAILRPHDGQPVHSVTFLSAPHRLDHIVLITGGPLNRELKIWISASDEGWLLPSDAESWKLTQTLVLESSETQLEEAFFNQVVALPQAGLLILANAKRNAIYAVHMEYGPNPAATCFDFIAEFTVTMPILSFTGTSELMPSGEHVVQVYCVHTQTIQQYLVYLSQCLPSPMENVTSEKSDFSFSVDAASSERFDLVEPSVKEVHDSVTGKVVGSLSCMPAQPSTKGNEQKEKSGANSVSPYEKSDFSFSEDAASSERFDLVEPSVKEVHDSVTGKVVGSLSCMPAQPSTKGNEQKEKSGANSVSPYEKSDFSFSEDAASSERFDLVEPSVKSPDSVVEPDISSSTFPVETAASKILPMQEMLNQLLMGMQKEIQEQMAALERCMEKSVKINFDALCAQLQEENTKQEKAARDHMMQQLSNIARDHMQQLSNVISNCLNRDLPATIEKIVKRELTTVGQSMARTITPTIEKTISTSIAESFQRGLGDNALNQLEKSVSSKLEGTVASQIQAQFQISGKQALQEALKSNFEVSVVPAFEMSCRNMFAQVHSAFQRGMVEHTAVALQQVEASHSPLALSLRDVLNSATSITQTLGSELLDGQRKLLAFASAGAYSEAVLNQLISQLSEKLEGPPDPRTELSRLIGQRKYEEAFISALNRRNLDILSWLCYEVDLLGFLSIYPPPLSQVVLLTLLHHLACDISKDRARKLIWMRQIVSVMDKNDPIIRVHLRPIFVQVSEILESSCSLLPIITGPELCNIRLIYHALNSMLKDSTTSV